MTREKRWIKIDISGLYLVKDGKVMKLGNLYVASFKLHYRSNNFSSDARKVLYIIKENGKWRILGEGNL